MNCQIEPKFVWLDCDPGNDDAMAIFLAAQSPQLKLIGISTVFGNTSVENCANNAVSLLYMAGIKDVQVYQGLQSSLFREQYVQMDFHGETGLGGRILPKSDQKIIKEDVFYKINQVIQSQPRKITFIATGSLSNLALLLNLYPQLKEKIELISIMGGGICIGNITPSAEFNIYIDPEAAKIVFESGIPLAMCPLDLTYKLKVNNEITSRIEKELNSEFSSYVVSFLNFYQDAYRTQQNLDYAPLHDPCAVYYVINPSVFQTKFRNVTIETKGDYCVGRTVVDEYGSTGRKPNCIVCLDMKNDLFWEEMISALRKCNKESPIN